MCCLRCRQGIYRRADANVGLGRMRKALTDYKRAALVNPRDPDLRKKLAQCEKEVKRIRFEEAVATPVRCCAACRWHHPCCCRVLHHSPCKCKSTIPYVRRRSITLALEDAGATVSRHPLNRCSAMSDLRQS